MDVTTVIQINKASLIESCDQSLNQFLRPLSDHSAMTDSILAGFQFFEKTSSVDVLNALPVWIPSGLLRKRDLFSVLSQGLNFPGYFGWNWDALEECLRDLSWIEQPRRILLIHEGLPFQPDWENRATYLSILKDAIATWGPNQPHELIAIFPTRCRDEILAAL